MRSPFGTLELRGPFAARPALTLNFLNGVLDPRITHTRASTATYIGSDGLLKTASVDQPRFDYDPVTLACKGLLIEGARTNSIRNNTMQGAVSGTPGTMPINWATTVNTTTGVNREVVGTGIEDGISYVDVRFVGTAVGAGSFDLVFETINSVPALTGQSWSLGFFWRLVAGSATGLSSPIRYLYEYTSGGAFVTAPSAGSLSFPTNAPLRQQRVLGSGTLSGGATTAFVRPVVKVNIANGATIDVTLRIGMPQLEFGAFVTSVIPTTTTAVTCAADVLTMTGTNFSRWFNPLEGTFVVDFAAPLLGSSTNSGLIVCGVGGNTTSNRIMMFSGSGKVPVWSLASGGVTSAYNIGANFFTPNETNKFAATYKANDFASCANGGAVATDTSGAVPVGLDRMDIGSAIGGVTQPNGHIRRIRYYPQRLSNTRLQELST